MDIKRNHKLRSHEVNVTMPTITQWLNSSEVSIGFDCSDHPTHIPYLVMDPQVGWFRLQKVLMDGGSNIDILYAATLRCMGIPES